MSPAKPAEAPPRWVAWVGPATFVLGLVGTVIVSAMTGLAFWEEKRFHVIEHAMALPRAVSGSGLGATVSSAGRGIYEELAPHGIWPGLLSAWIAEWARTHGVTNWLAASRFGWLLVTGAAPACLYAIVAKGRDWRVALLSSVILFATPRWTHGAAMAAEPVVTASSWFLLFALYLHARPAPHEAAGRSRRRFRVAGALFAVALGAALAASLSSAWILPVILLHAMLAGGPGSMRAVRHSRVQLPFGFLMALVLAPVTMALLTPSLWRGGATSIAGFLLAPLGPTMEMGSYREGPFTADTVPVLYAAHFLGATTPVLTFLLAFVGVVVIAREAWGRRTGGRVAGNIGFLAAVLIPAVLASNVVAPDVLQRFPPRAEAALPLIAALAAVAVDKVAARAVGASRRSFMIAVASAGFLGVGLLGISTAGASFALPVGETRGAVSGQLWVVGDGSELTELLPKIDALGRPSLSLRTTDASRGWFLAQKSLGRLKTTVEVAPKGEYALYRGPRHDALAEVLHWRAPVWSFTR